MYTEYHQLITKIKTIKNPLLLLLDGLVDPRNLGAILRTAEAAGVAGVIIPKKRCVGITDTVRRTATGAVDFLTIAQVGNLTQTLLDLKKEKFWVVGLDASGATLYTKIDYQSPLALVIGSEGRGLSRLVRETCDFIARIPMAGQITALNASVAAAIIMYEIVRQRHDT
jgi:23S rRNA (guanosine2251-2'-O)-methyltransferase